MIVGYLFPEPDLNANEGVEWSCYANMEQGLGARIGGKLYVTAHRLIFIPCRFDRTLGGDRWSVERFLIVKVQRVPAVGGLRRSEGRMVQISSADGDSATFVVNKAGQVAAHLRASLGLSE